MGSIPKIVSTPLKWVSKKVLHATLLRFPGGNEHSPIACIYCPEMCRFSCPTAVVSGNDVVTPCNKMGLLYKESKWPGQAAGDAPLWPIYDCTGCGRCTEYCVYEMPVADQLFEARKKWKWKNAEEAAQKIAEALEARENDYEIDPVGDLADELGDEVTAKHRLDHFLHRDQKLQKLEEPKALVYLMKNGSSSQLKWETLLQGPIPEAIHQKLQGKAWLFHESVWWSRHLNRSAEAAAWMDKARASGLRIQAPFAQGKDCIDCGGEGAYSYLFEEQSLRMAQECWEKDRHRVEGILCMSTRCARHFRRALGTDVPVLSFSDLVDLNGLSGK